MNPTAWLNYVFISNYARVKSQERPVILHRWGGLGNHKVLNECYVRKRALTLDSSLGVSAAMLCRHGPRCSSNRTSRTQPPMWATCGRTTSAVTLGPRLPNFVRIDLC